MEKEGIKIIANNKKASYEYFLSDFLECGIVLQGTEIKSLRVNGASLSDSYVIIRNGEMFILGMNIAQNLANSGLKELNFENFLGSPIIISKLFFSIT